MKTNRTMPTTQSERHANPVTAHPRVSVTGPATGKQGGRQTTQAADANRPTPSNGGTGGESEQSNQLRIPRDDADGVALSRTTSTYSLKHEFIPAREYDLSFPWRHIGSFIEPSDDLDEEQLKGLSVSGTAKKVTIYIYEKYYADLYWNCSLVVCCCFAAWCFAYFGFGFFSFIFVAICTFAVYRAEFRRFNVNIRDDMQRIQSKENLEKKLESMEWLNNFLSKFWVIYMPALSEMVITQTNQTLSQVAPPPPIDKLTLNEFTLGTKAPKIDSIKSFTKLGHDTYQMDWKFNFTPTDISDMTQNQLKDKIDPKIALGIRIGKGFVGASLPVLVEDMSFIGNLRIKIKLGDIFPHIDIVSICFLEPPKIDYALKPVGGNTLGIDVMSVIPGLSSFVNSIINSNLAPMMYYPNTIDIKPADFLTPPSAIGCLAVKIRGAEFISTQSVNPYVKYGLENGTVYQTDIKSNTTVPIFNESKRFLISDLNSKLRFEMFNVNEKGTSLSLGEAYFELQDLLQDQILELNESKFIKNNKNVGRIIYDLKWYPVLKSEILPDGVKTNEPDSEIGIIDLDILSASDLDVSKSLVGKLSTFVEVYIDNKLIETSRIVKGNNVPEYNFKFESLVFNKSTSILKILVKDISSFNETTIAEFESRILDISLIGKDHLGNADNTNNNYNKSSKKFSKGKGSLQFSSIWKPLGNLPEDDDDDDVTFIPPIGVFKININSCSKLPNLEKLGKIDPYVKISSGGKVKAVTSTIENSLDPQFDEEFYISILSEHQKIKFDCLDFNHNNNDDLLIGSSILSLSQFFKNKSNQYKPYNFKHNLIRNGKESGIIDFTITYYPLLKLFSHKQLNQIQQQSLKSKEDEAQEFEELEEQIKYLEDYKKHPDEYEWIDSNEEVNNILEANKDKVILSINDLLKYNSGVLGVNLLSGKLTEKTAFVEFYIDDHAYPDFISRKSRNGNLSSISGDGFVRDLPHSILNIRIVKNKNARFKNDIIYETIDSFNVIELLTKGYDTPIDLDLDGNKLSLLFEYVPSVNDSNAIFETVADTGLLKIDILDAQHLLAMDPNGKSDPYVEGYLNNNRVFKTKIVKKTLNPTFNETFSIPIKSKQRQQLCLKLFDWDLTGNDDKLGSVKIDLHKIPIGENLSATCNLDTQGSINLRFNFKPGYLKPNSSLLLTKGDSTLDLLSPLDTAGQLATNAVGIAGGIATGAVGAATGAVGAAGGLAGGLTSGATGAVSKAGGFAGGVGKMWRGSGNDDSNGGEEHSKASNFEPRLKLKPSFLSHKHRKSETGTVGSSSRGSFNLPRPSDVSVNHRDEFQGQMKLPSSPGVINNDNYAKPRTSTDAVSIKTNAFSGSAAIPGRLSVLELVNGDSSLNNYNLSIKVVMRSQNGTEKAIMKTRKYKFDSKNSSVKWHENVAFKCDTLTSIVFILRSSHKFGKSEELARGEIPLEQVAGNKDDVSVSLHGANGNGDLIVNFNFA